MTTRKQNNNKAAFAKQRVREWLLAAWKEGFRSGYRKGYHFGIHEKPGSPTYPDFDKVVSKRFGTLALQNIRHNSLRKITPDVMTPLRIQKSKK